ncbi:hypothetical protein H4R18_001074 [Coemansia javaensis]|uniref:Cep57 centrosome microtubule-binding domain-containing protein n=1 Tax=Coemansia javaensis TaxID=2761396 RepID=A0A9W8LL82_9FUNG|nr:hypothetical protein H4R18_001074 [Coemansia javaensis]
MVTDMEEEHHLSFGDHASGQVTEELSGFVSGSQTEDHMENLLNAGDTVSDIGRVVSQAEAGMDFTTNLDAPMEGVVRKPGRPVLAPRARAAANHVGDMSMSRLADSYWRPQDTSGLSELGPDDLQSMEFSTHSAADNAATAPAAAARGSGGSAGGNGGSAAGPAASHRRLGSFHSDSLPHQSGPTLPRRPESYHALQPDGPSAFDGPSSSEHRRPAAPAAPAPLPPSAAGNAPGERFARLAARYFNPHNEGEAAGAAAAAEYQADASLDGMSDTPDIHTAFTSGQLSMTEPSPSPPPPQQHQHQHQRLGREALPSIVERTHTALQLRFSSADDVTEMQHQQHQQRLHSLLGARAQSQPIISERALDDGPSAQGARYAEDARYANGAQYPMDDYDHDLPGFSMESPSLGSLDHPNLGSQGTATRDNSMASMRSDGGYRDGEHEFGAHMINSFGNSPTTPGAGPLDVRTSGAGTPEQAAEYEDFASVANADELFGEAHSSNPGMSDIERDHEQVFRDLLSDSDDDDDDDGIGIGMSDEFDPSRPPASLFTSSASIVAEIRRRQGQQGHGPQHESRTHRAFTSWDGREATPETLRLQEQRYSEHNPMDMLEKSNSLGISDHDVSGLLPESEILSGTRSRAPPPDSKAQSGLPTPQTAAHGLRAQLSPGAAHEPPPPTTPTTFISRDTMRRPSSRVLHRVPPLDAAGSSRTSLSREQSADAPATVRRPAGPRAQTRPPMLSIPQRRNARAAAEFAQATRSDGGAAGDDPSSMASSHGLGSLFQDSLPTLDISRLSRTPNTPLRILSRTANHSPSTQGGGSYVPFQDPTVDVSQLARYNNVDIGDAWSLRKQRSGVSADRMDSPAQQRRLPLVGDREIRSAAGDDSDDMVATVKFDSPTPPAAPGGPTLADIYELLQKTVSSLNGHKAPAPPQDLPAANGLGAEDPAAYQHIPDARPMAPTPRRSRMFPRAADGSSDGGGGLRRAHTADYAEPAHERLRQPLQRHTSDSMLGDYAAAPRRPFVPLPGHSEASAGAPAGEALEDLMRSVGIRDDEMQRIPASLSDKLMELAAALARSRGAAVDSAMQTDNEGRQADVVRLHQSILARLDEYRAEIDQLRTEVRRGSSAATPPGLLRVNAGGSAVAPHDSVSFAAARRAAAADPELAERFLTPSPRAEPAGRPLYTGPSTAKNRQRHMVQWLASQDAPSDTPESPGAAGRRSQDALVFTTPSLQRARVDRASDAVPGSVPRAGSRGRRATVEDVTDDYDGAGYDRNDGYDGVGYYGAVSPDVLPPADGSRGKDAAAAADAEDALSDASTTVPGRLRMRSPMDPAMINPPNVPSRRQQLRQAPGAWGAADDLLQARETLDSVRRRRRQRQQKASNDDDDDDNNDEAQPVYSKQMTQQLAQTLAELQRVHLGHFHGPGARARRCPVCAALEAQNQDPYLFGRHAVAYKSMSTRELQGMLNAYVAAMEDELRRTPEHDDALGFTRQDRRPAHHSFTPSRKGSARERTAPAAPSPLDARDAEATRMVIGLLREELGALSRRYHRMADEYRRLNPSRAEDQRRRRQMARELKDLVDLLDVKGEQIAVLAGLHPSLHDDAPAAAPDGGAPAARQPSSIERAFQSARALQHALSDLY